MEFTNQITLDRALKLIFMQMGSNNPRKKGSSKYAVPFVLSKPGAGKTEIIDQMCAKRNWGQLVTHLPTLTVEELTGLPEFVDVKFDGKTMKGTNWTLPDVISRLWDLAGKHEGVVWFLDDYHLAGPDMQKFCFQLFTDYTLKGYELPDNVHIILAGNPGAKAGAKQTLSAITNRVSFYPVVSDYEDWKAWALGNGVDPTIISFLGKSQYKNKWFHEDENNKEAWASPRSWVKFSNALGDVKEIGSGAEVDELVAYLCEGRVGTRAASDFSSYWNVFSKVDTSSIFDKKKIKTAKESGANEYIWAMAVTHEYIHRFSKAFGTKTSADPNYMGEDEKVTKDVSDTMTKVLAAVAKEDRDTAVIMLKTVADNVKITKNIKILAGPMKAVKKIDDKIYDQLSRLIRRINGGN